MDKKEVMVTGSFSPLNFPGPTISAQSPFPYFPAAVFPDTAKAVVGDKKLTSGWGQYAHEPSAAHRPACGSPKASRP